jgi:deoxyadenosine/deoxycytidine kinase
MAKSPVVWVEGPIAAGKSTFCRRIGKELDFDVIEEPVAANPYLEKFYQNPKQWAFPMQIHLLHYRFAMKQEAAYGAATGRRRGVILDRCIAGDKVFAKLHLDAGNIHPLNWDTYEFCYDVMASSIHPPTLMVYLHCQPETCFERMKKRDRPAEKGVTFQYLSGLIKEYQRMLRDLETGRTPWGRAVRVEKIIYDKNVQSASEWRNISKTVLDACERLL